MVLVTVVEVLETNVVLETVVDVWLLLVDVTVVLVTSQRTSTRRNPVPTDQPKITGG